MFRTRFDKLSLQILCPRRLNTAAASLRFNPDPSWYSCGDDHQPRSSRFVVFDRAICNQMTPTHSLSLVTPLATRIALKIVPQAVLSCSYLRNQLDHSVHQQLSTAPEMFITQSAA